MRKACAIQLLCDLKAIITRRDDDGDVARLLEEIVKLTDDHTAKRLPGLLRIVVHKITDAHAWRKLVQETGGIPA